MWKDLHTHADYMHVAGYCYWLSDNCSSSKAIQIASTVYTTTVSTVYCIYCSKAVQATGMIKLNQR